MSTALKILKAIVEINNNMVIIEHERRPMNILKILSKIFVCEWLNTKK